MDDLWLRVLFWLWLFRFLLPGIHQFSHVQLDPAWFLLLPPLPHLEARTDGPLDRGVSI